MLCTTEQNHKINNIFAFPSVRAGYAILSIDIGAKAVMAVGIKHLRHARDEASFVVLCTMLAACAGRDEKLGVAVVPTPSINRDTGSLKKFIIHKTSFDFLFV